MEPARPPTPTLTLAATALAASLACFAVLADERLWEPVTLLLAAGSVVANLLSVRYSGALFVSASYTCGVVALAIVGPAAACLVVVVGEVGSWAVERYRPWHMLVNVLACGTPALVAGSLFALVAPSPDDPLAFVLTLAPAAMLTLVLSFAVVSILAAPTLGEGLRASLHPPSPFAPALLWAVPVAATTAYLSVHVPTLGLLGVVVTILGVTYMLQLVAARRTQEAERSLAANDMVAGLLRALQQRDPESARHAAAVAQYASAIAEAAGMDEDRCRDAHAAGLMHDLGRLSLSDVALRADGDLTESEWQAIQRHPRAGADMLRNLGVPDTVAHAVEAHHERPDGRGYPAGLSDHEIPDLAGVVAVAEVYDILTAGTTYRPHMSSFQALTELRRVSGTQLDGRCVDALAATLAHRPFEERHATRVDLDAELAFERRLAQALTP